MASMVRESGLPGVLAPRTQDWRRALGARRLASCLRAALVKYVRGCHWHEALTYAGSHGRSTLLVPFSASIARWTRDAVFARTLASGLVASSTRRADGMTFARCPWWLCSRSSRRLADFGFGEMRAVLRSVYVMRVQSGPGAEQADGERK